MRSRGPDPGTGYPSAVTWGLQEGAGRRCRAQGYEGARATRGLWGPGRAPPGPLPPTLTSFSFWRKSTNMSDTEEAVEEYEG